MHVLNRVFSNLFFLFGCYMGACKYNTIMYVCTHDKYVKKTNLKKLRFSTWIMKNNNNNNGNYNSPSVFGCYSVVISFRWNFVAISSIITYRFPMAYLPLLFRSYFFVIWLLNQDISIPSIITYGIILRYFWYVNRCFSNSVKRNLTMRS